MKECEKNYSSCAECDEAPCELSPTILKHCPFCGAEAISEKDIPTKGLHAICCENIDCPVKPFVVGKTMQEAMNRWNTRKSKDLEN